MSPKSRTFTDIYMVSSLCSSVIDEGERGKVREKMGGEVPHSHSPITSVTGGKLVPYPPPPRPITIQTSVVSRLFRCITSLVFVC